MHDLDLIFTLAIAFSAALALGYLTHRHKLSPILGYLLAGAPEERVREEVDRIRAEFAPPRTGAPQPR